MGMGLQVIVVSFFILPLLRRVFGLYLENSKLGCFRLVSVI